MYLQSECFWEQRERNDPPAGVENPVNDALPQLNDVLLFFRFVSSFKVLEQGCPGERIGDQDEHQTQGRAYHPQCFLQDPLAPTGHTRF